MTRVAPFIFAVALLSGCSAHRTTYRTVGELRVGMRAEDAIAQMRPRSFDWGRVYYGGTGASRIYFQTSSTQQVWLEVSGAPAFAVTAIGTPEPKTQWTRHGGDSITVQ